MMKAAILIQATALAMAMALTTPVRAETAALDFDQGVDVSGMLKDLKAKTPEAAKDIKVAAVHAFYFRYDRDCARFTFGPNDNPQGSEVWLKSTEWVEECYPNPNYPSPYPPNYPPHPGPGYPPHRDQSAVTAHAGPGQNCYERPGRTYQQRASVSIRDRQQLFPWEFDSFEVCLEGQWLNFRGAETAYEYKVVQGGDYDGRYVVSPVRKIQMKPDPTGITAQALASNMTLTLKDKWASFYAGEQTVLILKLKKDIPNWFDATLLEKELTVAAAETYAVDFKAFASEFSQKLENGKKYYVDYSFKRIGRISKDSVMKVGETDRAVYQPAPAALGR